MPASAASCRRSAQAALDLLDPQPGEPILDVGCGDGALTAEDRRARRAVVGIDNSLEHGRRGQGARARRAADGRRATCDFSEAFDAVFSNATLHWVLDKERAARAIWFALKPGGRFAGEMGGEGNLAALREALDDELIARGYRPADLRRQLVSGGRGVRRRLRGAPASRDIDARLIERPTPLEHGVAAWVLTFRAGWLDRAGVPDDERADIAEAVAARVGTQYRRLCPPSLHHEKAQLMRYLPLIRRRPQRECSRSIGAGSIDDLFADVPRGGAARRADPTACRCMPAKWRSSATSARWRARIWSRAKCPSSSAAAPTASRPGQRRPSDPARRVPDRYTPYQPEIAQGTLQMLFEFQTQVARLSAATSPMPRCTTARPPAGKRSAWRGGSRGGAKAILSSGLHPHYVAVCADDGASSPATRSTPRCPSSTPRPTPSG